MLKYGDIAGIIPWSGSHTRPQWGRTYNAELDAQLNRKAGPGGLGPESALRRRAGRRRGGCHRPQHRQPKR